MLDQSLELSCQVHSFVKRDYETARLLPVSWNKADLLQQKLCCMKTNEVEELLKKIKVKHAVPEYVNIVVSGSHQKTKRQPTRRLDEPVAPFKVHQTLLNANTDLLRPAFTVFSVIVSAITDQYPQETLALSLKKKKHNAYPKRFIIHFLL
jgi:hypothetical protein